MLRTVFTLGVFALLGIFLLGSVFSLFGFMMGAAMWVLGLANKVQISGVIVYVVIRIVSPETARRLRTRFSGSGC